MQTLKDLYIDQLEDLYDAEQQLVETLPKLAKEAQFDELKNAIMNHFDETKEQVNRLETIFSRHHIKAKSVTCKAMKGLIAEGESEIRKWDNPFVKDAALITSAQRVEHYEMAAYGTARCYADCLGYEDDVELLSKTLQEEKDADAKLNSIAISSVNQDALGQVLDQESESRIST